MEEGKNLEILYNKNTIKSEAENERVNEKS